MRKIIRSGKPGGRTLFTPKLVKLLLQLLSVGTPIPIACQGAGVAYRTFREWMVMGEQGTKPFAEFHQDVNKAQGMAVVARLQRIQKAAKRGVWQADAWWLERRYPSDFGIRHEITGAGGGPVEIIDTARDRLAQILQQMHDAQQAGLAKPNGQDLLLPAKPNGHS